MFDGVLVKKNELLAPYTTLKVGGPADYFVTPQNQEELAQVIREANRIQMPIWMLAGGSNLLVSDAGVRGLVIQLGEGFKACEISQEGQKIRVGAAYSFPKLTRQCLELGWERALGWCGTPGLVGGALKMNAGTRLGFIGDQVESVEGVDAQGNRLRLEKESVGFGYRYTNYPEGFVICGATLIAKLSESSSSSNLLLKATELAKHRKKTQPKERSCGSVFKNPPGDYAGRLIEACGLKGFELKGVRVSEVHANFFVNPGKGLAKDVFELSQLVMEKVYNQFGVRLEYEVRRWGF